MSEMIERVARAIGQQQHQGWLSDEKLTTMCRPEAIAFKRECLLNAAVAAIEAMREPTDEMIVAGDERILAHLNSHELRAATPTPSQNCFIAMINEALTSPSTSPLHESVPQSHPLLSDKP